MTTGVVDTTVILHYFRRYAGARLWVDTQPARLAVTSITWMEVMEGTRSKSAQVLCKAVLDKFEIFFPTPADQVWAMQQLEQFQFSHHNGS